MTDYPAFKPIPRLHRDITITEKIDGTNGLIDIRPVDESFQEPDETGIFATVDGEQFAVFAGSRSRWIYPGMDNHGFAGWVFANASPLVRTLGTGRHYGEWWGAGIQRRYGMTEKRFSLFNTARWSDADLSGVHCLDVVPVLEQTTGQYLNQAVDAQLHRLKITGSVAAPGFEKPEGVVIYHRALNGFFKATIDKDDEWKGKSK